MTIVCIKRRIGSKDTILQPLETIPSNREMFTVDCIINVILGRSNTQIQAFKHDRLKCFSMGARFQMDDHFGFHC
ncbi:MAG: hypothetical protein IPG85_16935 [Bacteroidetes bacterium]|nr:hypothetical protein [Bacteroidota bacterium]